MESESSGQSQQGERPRGPPLGLLTLAVMVAMTCASIAWGLTTLECLTGKDRWGACNPPPDVVETQGFVQRLLAHQ